MCGKLTNGNSLAFHNLFWYESHRGVYAHSTVTLISKMRTFSFIVKRFIFVFPIFIPSTVFLISIIPWLYGCAWSFQRKIFIFMLYLFK